ncbi:MAG: class I SAM-dependent methyltransferase [Bacteroidales bacterium]
MQKNTKASDMKGKPVERTENCRVCNERTGEFLADVDYWNIKTSRLVKCTKCNHIQLDPMLSESESAKGCYAYYLEEALRTTPKEQMANCLRNFRRGVVFGYSLKRRKIFPRSVLELGPGLGYFSVGLKFVFPGADIAVMDINAELASFNEDHHNYRSIHGVPDIFMPEFKGTFDLVIARDVIEHVNEISAVIENINRYLTPGGYFHFITPNGREDAWRSYLTSLFTNSSSELLINHVNYYDGKGLGKLLFQKGFIPVDYYTYKIKTTLSGLGWKKNKKLMSPVSVRKDADLLIRENAMEVSGAGLVKEKILNKWYIQDRAKWITATYSLYQHFNMIRINPGLNIGHEIYGLFQKAQHISL